MHLFYYFIFLFVFRLQNNFHAFFFLKRLLLNNIVFALSICIKIIIITSYFFLNFILDLKIFFLFSNYLSWRFFPNVWCFLVERIFLKLLTCLFLDNLVFRHVKHLYFLLNFLMIILPYFGFHFRFRCLLWRFQGIIRYIQIIFYLAFLTFNFTSSSPSLFLSYALKNFSFYLKRKMNFR